MKSHLLVLSLAAAFSIQSLAANAETCVTKFPNMQALDNALINGVAQFTQNVVASGASVDSTLLPVTLGDAIADGYGNCHLTVYLGKDKHPAGADPVSNYQAFIGLRMWDLGFTVENRGQFIDIVTANIKNANIKGVDPSKLATDADFASAIANVWNNAQLFNNYEYGVYSALQALGMYPY